jgi:PadR family transcriptional regulator PadR
MDNEKEFPRGQLNPTILHTLLEKDKYGYEIIEEIKNKTGIEIKQPSLYSSLKRMEAQKLISSYWQDSEIGGKRHYYCLTAIGKEFLAKNPVDFSIFKNNLSEKQEPKTEIIEQDVKNVVKEIGEKIKQAVEISKEEEKPRFAQQDNIFNSIKVTDEPVKVNNAEEQEVKSDFVQYDLFANLKIEEPEVKNEFVRQRNLRNKNSSDPYQLQYLSEDELKSEFERIRNQKAGIVSNEPQVTTAPSQQPEQPSQQPNIWLSRNSYMNSQKDEKETLNVYIAKEENVEEKIEDDGRFITEKVNFENSPAPKSTPSLLNIESNNYVSLLNSKVNQSEDQSYQQKVVDMYAKNDSPKYDFNSSLANLESKFEKYKSNKTNPVIENETKFDKVENTYERIKNSSPVFNSYKSLEAYFNSKGIGFYPYVKKEKDSNEYVDFSLIKFIRGTIFSLFSIILAFSFYFGINYSSIGKVTYIIFPILAIALTAFYGFNYYKTKSNIIIQMEKAVLSPIILPIISACAILVVIAINLIIGFSSGNTLYYFPLLIYPICLSFHIAMITPLNKLIRVAVLKYRESFSKNKK